MLVHPKLYTSCETLPLYNWIKLLVTSDLKYLYVSRPMFYHNHSKAAEVWENIFNEYTELTNDEKTNQVLSLIKGITVINNKLEIVQSAINLLAIARPLSDYQATIKLLKDFGFNYRFNDQTISDDLKRTASSAKRMIIQRKQMESDYEKVNSGTEKATEKDYYNMLTQLSKFLGFHVDAKKTNVLQYISYVEQFNNSLKDERAINK